MFLLPTQIRTELEMQMVCNLREFKEFIDNEMIVILGQMDSPTQIFDHVFLVSLMVNSRVNTPNASHYVLGDTGASGGTERYSEGEIGWSWDHVLLSKTQDTSAIEEEQPGFVAALNFAMQHQLSCRPFH